ncbi:MAG: ThuA domain-containing protein [Chitinophagaceae bacterium]
MKYYFLTAVLIGSMLSSFASDRRLKILVFTKTVEFRHKSIPKGIETFKKLALENNWDIDYSDDASKFDSTLFQYDVLVFLSTTGDILNDTQQQFLKDYIARGKGFVGIHAATDTEHGWPWYAKMIGAEFSKHPKHQNAVVKSTNLYNAFYGKDYKTRTVFDEWYNFKEPVKPYVNVLSYVDETSYEGGEMNGNHPITWYHHFDGGRIFYTGMGHMDDQFDDAIFLNELIVGVKWAGGLINDPAPAKKLTNLLTDNLNDNWVAFMGVPHGSVKDLPGVDLKSDGKIGVPLGLSNDIKQVFKMEKDGDENVLHISGEIFGGLTSKLEYENYHLRVQFKWGDKIWEPRLAHPKDNGILYHANGSYTTFWNVWMQSSEFQVQRHDMGDFYALGGVKASIALAPVNDGTEVGYKKGATKADVTTGSEAPYNHAKRSIDSEKPEGKWNTLDLYCLGNKSVYVVNGKVVMVLENLMRLNAEKEWVIANKGLIQIQSEGAEAYYKNIQIETISQFPKHVRKQF